MLPTIKGSNTQTANQPNAQPMAQKQIGLISKLNSEIKLIESMSMIRLTGSEKISFQGKPAQLLQATTQQNTTFNLINTGKPITISGNENTQIRLNGTHQASLTLPQSAAATNLALASRVVNLTVLSASVQTNTNGQAQYSAQVSDGQNHFMINTQTALKKGDVLRVFMDNKNQLQVLPSNNSQTSSLSIEALKQSLPKQLSASEMAQLLKQLQSIQHTTTPLPPKVQQALTQLIQNLPNIDTLTQSPSAMKQALQTSGQFSESLLKNNHPLAAADLKLNLSRLNTTHQETSSLKPFPTDQIANAIERISTNQLRHFADSNQPYAQMFPMHIDLPIKEGQQNHLVQLDIDQDASTKELPKEERRWLVKLKFDFEETGRFDTRLSIQGNKVGIVFAAEQKTTQTAIRQHMEELKQKLREKDIEVERLDVFQGKLKEDPPVKPKHTTLIDERT
ncbi:Flagellar hook-length control protein FliK [Marinomonas spartinae]|uniref:flagellar hook-length control protein FliK n=1 Tax=Marinomonas spartinae TaxID=1792290 RepID=UPI000808CF47|nr:flagellar hook-length control protein FliK [Marinomonas spartinae]SBS26527.1 Flagellar hook-length control protein FliK [Marinomonas spartinae]